MAQVYLGNDPAQSTALPVQVPGQQPGSISISLPSTTRVSQLDVINAARQEVQRTGSYNPVNDINPLYTKTGISNGYHESTYLPTGKPIPGPINSSSTARSVIQGFQFAPLDNAKVFGGSISDNFPPTGADSYARRR